MTNPVQQPGLASERDPMSNCTSNSCSKNVHIFDLNNSPPLMMAGADGKASLTLGGWRLARKAKRLACGPTTRTQHGASLGTFLPLTRPSVRCSGPWTPGLFRGVLGLPEVSCHWPGSLVGEGISAETSPPRVCLPGSSQLQSAFFQSSPIMRTLA